MEEPKNIEAALEYLRERMGKRQKPRTYEPTEESRAYFASIRNPEPTRSASDDQVRQRLLQITKDQEPRFERTAEWDRAVSTYFAASINQPPQGVLVIGNIGTGKSLLMRTLSKLSRYVENLPTFRVMSAHDIVECYERTGDGGGNDFLAELNKSALCIDDFGTEKIAFRYSKEEILRRIIEKRYDRKLVTHIVTNLSFAEISERYTQRVASRLTEMTRPVLLGASQDAKDWRRAK
jgi:DNA replication protein DnaC